MTDTGPEPEVGRKLIMNIGALIFYYAKLEHWIDGAVATIYLRIPEAKELSKHHPTNAADEICFLRRSLSTIEALADFREGPICSGVRALFPLPTCATPSPIDGRLGAAHYRRGGAGRCR